MPKINGGLFSAQFHIDIPWENRLKCVKRMLKINHRLFSAQFKIDLC